MKHRERQPQLPGTATRRAAAAADPGQFTRTDHHLWKAAQDSDEKVHVPLPIQHHREREKVRLKHSQRRASPHHRIVPVASPSARLRQPSDRQQQHPTARLTGPQHRVSSSPPPTILSHTAEEEEDFRRIEAELEAISALLLAQGRKLQHQEEHYHHHQQQGEHYHQQQQQQQQRRALPSWAQALQIPAERCLSSPSSSIPPFPSAPAAAGETTASFITSSQWPEAGDQQQRSLSPPSSEQVFVGFRSHHQYHLLSPSDIGPYIWGGGGSGSGSQGVVVPVLCSPPVGATATDSVSLSPNENIIVSSMMVFPTTSSSESVPCFRSPLPPPVVSPLSPSAHLHHSTSPPHLHLLKEEALHSTEGMLGTAEGGDVTPPHSFQPAVPYHSAESVAAAAPIGGAAAPSVGRRHTTTTTATTITTTTQSPPQQQQQHHHHPPKSLTNRELHEAISHMWGGGGRQQQKKKKKKGIPERHDFMGDY